MSIVITGATGAFGGHVVDHLLARGVPAGQIVATGRRAGALTELAELGVRTAAVDYDDIASLDAVLEPGDRLLLVSGNELGRRIIQHHNVIDAAVRAGVSLIAYTSVLNADDNPVSLAQDHRTTEAALAESGVPTVLLRNGWYLENHTGQLATYLQTGAVLGASGGGRIAGAAREDLDEAAAAVLAGGDHAGATYELGGQPFTLAELAAAVREETGTDVQHHDVPLAHFHATMHQAGLPSQVVAMLTSAEAATAVGALSTDATDLADLIGHAPTTLREAVAAAA